MSFLQRIGLRPATKVVQRGAMDENLANSLWNAITIVYLDTYENDGVYGYDGVNGSNRGSMVKCLWIEYFKKTTDHIPPRFSGVVEYLKEVFFNAECKEKYRFLEAVFRCGPEGCGPDFICVCNEFLERENSAYRFVNGQIAEITSDAEIESVETAIESASPFGGVRKHLNAALLHMNDRENPNYRNSIKESISAVEAVAKIVSGNKKATLGEVLKVLEKKGKLHPAQSKGFSALYGWTSRADGIRHGLMEKESLQKSDALYMLVTCSAFVNYLIAHVED